MDVIQRIKEKVEERMSQNSFSGHDYGHVLRVYNTAKNIGNIENADLLVLEAASLLHDIGYPEEKKHPEKDHAEESAKEALTILNEVDFPKEKIKDVLYAIRTHRFSKGILPETTEAKILQDADRLDALGAVGIMRCFFVAGAHNNSPYDPNDALCKNKLHYKDDKYSIDHFYKKLFKLKDTMHTLTARKIATERERFMREYLLKLEAEINGF